MNEDIVAELKRSADTISKIDPAQIRAAADMIYECVKRKGQVIFMGNGGSSADAQHIAAELSGRYAFDRPAMAGVCLSNVVPITAIGNDYSYDIIFQRQIEAFCRPGDVVVGLSTSGNSKNVILAVQKAKEIGAKTISFTGDQGKLRDAVDLAVIIPTKETARVQEGYLAALHTICGIVERAMYGRAAVLTDRDNTLCPDVPYCHDPAQMKVYPGVPAAIARLNRAGYEVIVISNQSGINRGYFDEKMLKAVNRAMLDQIEAGGGRIDGIYFCPHRPDEHCSCRKPEVGMGLRAIAEHHLDPVKCWMIGDADKDVQFGQRLGMQTVQVGADRNFVTAVNEILANTIKTSY